jgi:hypothetical protein
MEFKTLKIQKIPTDVSVTIYNFCIVIDHSQNDNSTFSVKTEPNSAEDFDLELNEIIQEGISTHAEAINLAYAYADLLEIGVYDDSSGNKGRELTDLR